MPLTSDPSDPRLTRGADDKPEVSALRAAVERVRALHQPATPRHAICVSCGQRVPCPTIAALDGAAAGGER